MGWDDALLGNFLVAGIISLLWLLLGCFLTFFGHHWGPLGTATRFFYLLGHHWGPLVTVNSFFLPSRASFEAIGYR
ncbi:hypothetical protein COJ96_21290 [Bacillus sp. AFS073361]|nr:hypothetical protein COJ96_21290 [Bacillus sp. AFS073361]